MENEYKIIKKLGEGGEGEVYLVEKDNQKYALKKMKMKLTKEDKDKYIIIINIISRMNNENIIKYYKIFEENDSLYILMEYGDDYNLKQFIKKYKDKNELIDENIINDIVIQICLGLKDIHKNKIKIK